VDGLQEAIKAAGPKGKGFTPCMACLDGKYPTDVTTSGRGVAATRKADRQVNERKAETPL
jgi:hypothetical protein